MKRLWMPPLSAHVLSWAAFFGVVFWPYGYSSTSLTQLPDGGMRLVLGHAPGPFMRYLGLLEITLLLIPQLVAGLAVWLVWRRATPSGLAKVTMWGLGLLCLGYCSVCPSQLRHRSRFPVQSAPTPRGWTKSRIFTLTLTLDL